MGPVHQPLTDAQE